MRDKPVAGTVARPHPGGLQGARIGLKETAERAWKARMSPRLRAWATQQLRACGDPNGKRSQVQCLLDAFRKKVPYVADPKYGEFIAHPEQLLCLDDGNLCIPGSDCEEMSLAMCALCLCIGLDAYVVGQSSRPPADVPTHVYFGFEDDSGDRVRADATTSYKVGRVAPFLREWWIDPSKVYDETGMGDFVALSSRDGLSDRPKVKTVLPPYMGPYWPLLRRE